MFRPALLLLAALLVSSCRSDDRATAPDTLAAGARPDSSVVERELRADSARYAGDESAPLQLPTRAVEAPDFTLPTLGEGSFTLSEHRGEVVVLNFWATWCGPCRHEIPDFIRLQEELGGRGVLFVGVSVDEQGADVVEPFAEEIGINYPVVLDDGTAEQKYGPLTVLPTTFVVGPDGILKRYAPGMLTADALRPVLLELL